MTTTSQVTIDTRSEEMSIGAWVGAGEIELLLGVSRQRVQQLVAEPDFPAADIELKMGKVWRTRRIRAWARRNGRKLKA